MGRKVTYMRLFAVIMLTAVISCITQTEKRYAQVSAAQEEAVYEDQYEEQEETDNEDEPGVPGEPEEPLIPAEKYQVIVSEPDGQQGYYIQKPEVKILHLWEGAVTRYIVTDADGMKTEGALEEKNSEIILPREYFKDGNNQLLLWSENAGEMIAESETYREINVDSKAPLINISAPKGLAAWYQKETILSVSAGDGDGGSQVESIVCYQGEQMLGISDKSQASFIINTPSFGGKGASVRVIATDKAGNIAESNQKIYIDQNPPEMGVQGVQDYMITSQPLEVDFWVKEENELQTLYAQSEWENTKQQIVKLPANDWVADGERQMAKQVLTEDGKYKIRLYASDKAGYTQERNVQVIIDKQNPVIQFVDELQNKYIREFTWDFPIEEAILDFTSYVYEIRLDGKLYQMGATVKKEGSHQFRVKAIDAAGNEAAAQANFIIDRTPPNIQFVDAVNNEIYEEEKSFKVMLENKEDIIQEIYINGKSQAITPDKLSYSYTVNEYKEYMVYVKAVDRAGNQKESQISFQVQPKKTVFEKMLDPVKKTANRKPQEANANKGEGKEFSLAGVILLIALAAGIAGVFVMKK